MRCCVMACRRASRRLATRSRAATSAEGPRAAASCGSASPASRARMASTTMSSSSVKPAVAATRFLPAAQLIGLRLAALRALRTKAVEVIGSMLAGHAVLIGMAPGIDDHLGALQIRAVPARFGGRLGDERTQALLARRIVSDLIGIEVERRAEAGDLNPGRLQLARGE